MVTKAQQKFPALESITRPSLTTVEAAYYMNRAPQTLRLWSHYKKGAVLPLCVNGRLAWPVADIKRVMGVAS
ncbi:DNA-binding protein [Rhodoferax ferrireducens]|uniref:DNA-binding protein n=1 Tax=Rhodoferax ferrireducens TaxID=192843 RepID=UPI000E0CF8EF|nr:DNA-binding protein [Rhodoferax ferrireducens]